jgi:hypothetical protein
MGYPKILVLILFILILKKIFSITPLGKYESPDRVLLVLPGLHKITSFKSFSIYALGHDVRIFKFLSKKFKCFSTILAL